ncbi:MAG: acetoacetate--CoA ligase [Pseudomonadota bacterium]
MAPDAKLLWTPGDTRVSGSRLRQFEHFVRDRLALEFADYRALHCWSVDQPEQFWECVWEFTEVVASKRANVTLADSGQFPGARWFDGARLNFAENLLRHPSNEVAIVARLENGERRTVTRRQLYADVARVAAALKLAGVSKGDRVVGVLPNVPETVIAMLATASVGALWSSCSPDFGVNGVVDRFGQIEPKVLIACDGYYYNGKTIDCREKVSAITQRLTSLSTTVIVPVIGAQDAVPSSQSWSQLLATAGSDPTLTFAQLPFDHPLYIMYSSGTTGVPKCIVHSAGGTLLQHLKEHQLHTGIGAGDLLFYFTTCGWMMWNWLVSALASGAAILLYDGSPFYPGPQALFDLADEEGVDVFGVGAKFVSAVEKAGLKPRMSHSLTQLRSILSTGSPLSHESFRYVYRDVKSDVCLSSISGGTDIVSCFALGNECLPVYEGELQCPGLGMAVEIWDESGKPVTGQKGELVCTRPFPSAPVGFWNDPDDKRYLKAYFATYPGVWAHGDYGEITGYGGLIIHGRSDAILNPGGVRIGTAEIYRQVERLDEVLEAICVGQDWDGDVRVVLFVVLTDGTSLTDELQAKIRHTIRNETTPRHVPAVIAAVADIPRTRSGKIAEIAVKKVINGESVDNVEALANPEALELYKGIPQLQA